MRQCCMEISRRVRMWTIGLVALPSLLAGCTGDDNASDSPPSTTAPPTAAAPLATGVIDGTLRTTDGRDRTYRLFVPEDLDAGDAVPLLVAMHGGTGWGGIYATISGYDDIASREGFIVVYPDGVGIGEDGASLRTWNAGDCCGPARRLEVDDVAYVHQLVDEIAERYPIDEHQIYGVGHSNGGMLAYRIACENPGRFAAIAHQAGSLGIDSCSPDRAVSFLHIHGTADLHVPIDGGVGPESAARVDFRSADASIGMVANALDCGPPITIASPSNRDVTTGTRSCTAGTEVVFMWVDGASHSWMGRPSPRGESYPALDASEAAWEFLAGHPRP